MARAMAEPIARMAAEQADQEAPFLAPAAAAAGAPQQDERATPARPATIERLRRDLEGPARGGRRRSAAATGGDVAAGSSSACANRMADPEARDGRVAPRVLGVGRRGVPAARASARSAAISGSADARIVRARAVRAGRVVELVEGQGQAENGDDVARSMRASR